eukprot:jgi/Mesen1/6351/ME000328S05637
MSSAVPDAGGVRRGGRGEAGRALLRRPPALPRRGKRGEGQPVCGAGAVGAAPDPKGAAEVRRRRQAAAGAAGQLRVRSRRLAEHPPSRPPARLPACPPARLPACLLACLLPAACRVSEPSPPCVCACTACAAQ